MPSPWSASTVVTHPSGSASKWYAATPGSPCWSMTEPMIESTRGVRSAMPDATSLVLNREAGDLQYGQHCCMPSDSFCASARMKQLAQNTCPHGVRHAASSGLRHIGQSSDASSILFNFS